MTTPVYGLPYPLIGQPIRDTRALLQTSAEAIEAALLARAVPPADGPQIVADAAVTRARGPYLRVRASGANTAAPVNTDSVFSQWNTAADYVKSGCWDKSTNAFRPPLAGWWRISAEISLNGATTAGSNIVLRLTRNYTSGTPTGVLSTDTRATAAGQAEVGLRVAYEGPLAVTDAVRLVFWSNATGLTYNNNRFGWSPYFHAYYLGPEQ